MTKYLRNSTHTGFTNNGTAISAQRYDETISELYDESAIRVDSMQGLLFASNPSDLADGACYLVQDFFSNSTGGGDPWFWDASGDKANHDGIRIVDPIHSATPGASGSTWWTSENTGTTGTFKRIEKGWYSVWDAGAKGDGSNNDYDAIQALIDTVQYIYVPIGIYNFDTTLSLRSDITILGAGTRDTVFQWTGSSGDTMLANETGDRIYYVNISNVTFNGGTNAQLSAGNVPATGFNLTGVNNSQLEKILIKQVSNAHVYMQGAVSVAGDRNALNNNFYYIDCFNGNPDNDGSTFATYGFRMIDEVNSNLLSHCKVKGADIGYSIIDEVNVSNSFSNANTLLHCKHEQDDKAGTLAFDLDSEYNSIISPRIEKIDKAVRFGSSSKCRFNIIYNPSIFFRNDMSVVYEGWDTALADGRINWIIDTADSSYHSFRNRIRTDTATNYSMSVPDDYVGVTDTTSPRTITVINYNDVEDGYVITIADESGGAGSNNITISTGGAGNIDGSSNVTINTNYGSKTLMRIPTGWKVIGEV